MSENEAFLKYEQLLTNLAEFFPTADAPEDRSAEFVYLYQTEGEDDPRFFGVVEQIDTAIKHPMEFSRVLEEQLGWEFTPVETRQYMVDLKNELTKPDPDVALRREALNSSESMFAYWSSQTLTLPGKLSVPRWGKHVPIYVVALSGAVLGGVGSLGMTYLGSVPVLGWLLMVLTLVGVGLLFYGAATMFWLRGEVVDEGRRIKREQELKEYGENLKRKRGILSFFRR